MQTAIEQARRRCQEGGLPGRWRRSATPCLPSIPHRPLVAPSFFFCHTLNAMMLGSRLRGVKLLLRLAPAVGAEQQGAASGGVLHLMWVVFGCWILQRQYSALVSCRPHLTLASRRCSVGWLLVEHSKSYFLHLQIDRAAY